MNTYHEIKFKHSICDKYNWSHTLAFIQPDLKKLIKQYKLSLDKLETPKVTFWYGLSLCHKDDQFSRKKGREISQTKVEQHEMDFWLTDDNDSYLIILSETYNRRFKVQIRLKIYKDSGKIRLIESEVNEI